MLRLKGAKTSVLYILFEGLSKGGSYILLIFIANFLSNDVYVSIMTLLSAETLLKMIFVTYYGEALYKLQDLYNKNKLFQTYNSTILVQTTVFIILIILLKNSLFTYFNHSNLFTYLSIIFNAILFNSFRLNSSYSQIIENHKKAIIYRSFPFFIAFLFSLLFVWKFQDKIFGFFIGKTVGFIIFWIAANKVTSINLQLKFDVKIFKNIFSRTKFLFSNAWLGWLTGIGFINVAKVLIDEQSEVAKFGYALNIYSIFLLLGYGINQVYGPKLKRLVNKESFMNAKKYSVRIQLLYLFISITLLIAFLSLNYIFQILNLSFSQIPNFVSFWNVVPAAIFIFLFSSFSWVVTPYYYILDNYNQLFKITIVSFIISFIVSLIIISNYNIVFGYIFLIAVKSVIISLNFIIQHSMLKKNNLE